MKPAPFFGDYLALMNRAIAAVDHHSLAAAAALLRAVKRSSCKVLIAGNGGSASIASHVAVDLTKAVGIRAVCFNNPELITCFGNDGVRARLRR